MGVVQLPDDLKQVIDRQVSQGRAASEADFLTEAIQRYAEALESAEEEVLAAADEGIADSEAGRYLVIGDNDDMDRLVADLRASRRRALEDRGTSVS